MVLQLCRPPATTATELTKLENRTVHEVNNAGIQDLVVKWDTDAASGHMICYSFTFGHSSVQGCSIFFYYLKVGYLDR